MAKKRAKTTYRRTFIKQWRQYRGLTQERLAARINKSTATVSQIETGKSPYSQEILEAIAEALLCEPVDLLIRNPKDPDGIWSIWDGLEPPKKRQAIGILKALKEAS